MIWALKVYRKKDDGMAVIKSRWLLDRKSGVIYKDEIWSWQTVWQQNTPIGKKTTMSEIQPADLKI